jgi:predicted esterase
MAKYEKRGDDETPVSKLRTPVAALPLLPFRDRRGTGVVAVPVQIPPPMQTPTEHHIHVRRTARYFVVGEPSHQTTELWVALHGYGQLAEPFARVLAPLSNGSRVIVAPEALSRFYLDEPAKRHGPDSPVGAAWMTREDRLNEIDDHVQFLDAVVDDVRTHIHGRELRIVIFGFSQGVATACRWAALGKTRPDRVILWAGAIAADLPTDRGDQLWYGASVVMVAGRQDAVVPVSFMQKERRTLTERGLKVDLVEYDGGHALNREALRQLGATD